MITATYKAEVVIPEHVWREFRESAEFERARMEAAKGSIESGTDLYSKVYEWATFSTRREAEECRKRLMDVMYKFSAKLLDENGYVKGGLPAAVVALNMEIEDGGEFPDEAHRIATRYGVDQAELEAAYDNQFK